MKAAHNNVRSHSGLQTKGSRNTGKQLDKGRKNMVASPCPAGMSNHLTKHSEAYFGKQIGFVRGVHSQFF